MLTFMTWLARFMAILGGIVLTAVVILTCVSILGRGIDEFAHGDFVETNLPALAAWLQGLGLGPVPGDHEITQAFVAFSIFAFLPICQMRGGHATVDIFTSKMPASATRYLKTLWEVVLALVILVIAWRLAVGFAEKYDNGQTTFFLQFPVWWSYGASLLAAAIAAIVGVYCAMARMIEIVTGRSILPSEDAPS